MEAKGQIWLAAPPPVVWSSMTDPAVLKVCVPGCKRVEREANGHYRFDLEGRWGFLHARFHVQVWVHDLDPPDAATPQRYTLSAQGQGPLGLAKGQSRIELTEHAEGSYLVYAADGAPDERLGKVGRSALRRVADTLSQKFFRRFAETIVQNHPDEDSAATP